MLFKVSSHTRNLESQEISTVVGEILKYKSENSQIFYKKSMEKNENQNCKIC